MLQLTRVNSLYGLVQADVRLVYHSDLDYNCIEVVRSPLFRLDRSGHVYKVVGRPIGNSISRDNLFLGHNVKV